MDTRILSIALCLLMGCAIDSRTFTIRDEAVAGRESEPDASDEGGAAGTMADEDSGPEDAALPDAPQPPLRCTKDEDCPDSVADCGVGRCDTSSGRCDLEQAPDCTECGNGSACVSGVCRIGGVFYSTLLDGDTLPEEFRTNPFAPWMMMSSDLAYDGRSAVSGRIGDESGSTLELTLDDVPNQSLISFYRRIDSDPFGGDELRFCIVANGREACLDEAWDGMQPWELIVEDVGAVGPVTFRWVYQKDMRDSGGEDRAWIDRITVWRDCL